MKGPQQMLMILIEIERLEDGTFRVWSGTLASQRGIEREDVVIVEASAAPLEDAAKVLIERRARHHDYSIREPYGDARLFVAGRNGKGRTQVFSPGTVGIISDGMRLPAEVAAHNAMIAALA
jgi:hypothetical protein